MKARYLLYTIAAFGIIICLVVAGSILSTVGSVVSAPSRVITKTLETNNIINNYEWFHDQYAAYQKQLGIIKDYKEFYATEQDSLERNKLRMELAAYKNICRKLVTEYNANATKSNRSIFMGTEAPESLDISTCE